MSTNNNILYLLKVEKLLHRLFKDILMTKKQATFRFVLV